MTRSFIHLLALLLTLSFGCAAQVQDPDVAEIELIAKADYAGVLYYEPGVHQIPIAVQSIDPTAEPVRLEFYEHIAVVWNAPRGVAQYGRENIRGVFEVLEHSGDPLEETDDPTVIAPPQAAPQVEHHTALNQHDVGYDVAKMPLATISWHDQLTDVERLRQLLEELEQFHPHCL